MDIVTVLVFVSKQKLYEAEKGQKGYPSRSCSTWGVWQGDLGGAQIDVSEGVSGDFHSGNMATNWGTWEKLGLKSLRYSQQKKRCKNM